MEKAFGAAAGLKKHLSAFPVHTRKKRGGKEKLIIIRGPKKRSIHPLLFTPGTRTIDSPLLQHTKPHKEYDGMRRKQWKKEKKKNREKSSLPRFSFSPAFDELIAGNLSRKKIELNFPTYAHCCIVYIVIYGGESTHRD